jgi:UDP-GlcNAc:undecaprenyl-phosphate/decaprenyl-phosphate GlcNAc-1-phosphate transferase
MQIILIFILSLLTCIAVLKAVIASKLGSRIVDLPNHRSLHVNPTPRIGGIGVSVSILLSAFALQLFLGTKLVILGPLMASFLVLVLLSIVDDAKSLSVRVRLPLHVLIATVWTLSYFFLNSAQWSSELLLLTIVAIPVAFGITWCTNLFNFMDGSDGLAGVMTLVGFGAYTVASFIAGDKTLTLISIATCGAATGFLYFNWPPARVFLGDSGSISLGFLASAIGTIGVFEGYWSFAFPLMVFSMFWVDATFTLCKRLFSGKRLSESHRDHWYQKAIRAGNSHFKVLFVHLICNLIIGALALTTLKPPTAGVGYLHASIIAVALSIALTFGFWAERQHKMTSLK